jgi:hypothetical protein
MAIDIAAVFGVVVGGLLMVLAAVACALQCAKNTCMLGCLPVLLYCYELLHRIRSAACRFQLA